MAILRIKFNRIFLLKLPYKKTHVSNMMQFQDQMAHIFYFQEKALRRARVNIGNIRIITNYNSKYLDVINGTLNGLIRPYCCTKLSNN